MAPVLFGIETEYAFAQTPPSMVGCDDPLDQFLHAARQRLPGVDDAGGRGIFLANGSRFLVDCGQHPEWNTPELGNPWDAVRYILAGERWLLRLMADVRDDEGRPAAFLRKTNVDYLTRATWGTHESVLYKNASLRALAAGLLPFLVTRVVFTGAGGFDPLVPGAEFCLSPRSRHLQHELSRESTWSRALVHTKQESLSGADYKRLHLICGESLNSEAAMWLRSATLVMCVCLVEAGLPIGRAVCLPNAVPALHALIADPTLQCPLPLRDGSTMTAIRIQRHYVEQAEAAPADVMPPWRDEACAKWRRMLDRLESGPDAVSTTLDWAVKRVTFQRLITRRGYTHRQVQAWNDVLRELSARIFDGRATDVFNFPEVLFDAEAMAQIGGEVRRHQRALAPRLDALGLDWRGVEDFVALRHTLFEADARFADLGDAGIWAALDRQGVLTHHVPGVDNIEHAMDHPPASGRAAIRGRVIGRVLEERDAYTATWSSVEDLERGRTLDLADPFETDEKWRARQP